MSNHLSSGQLRPPSRWLAALPLLWAVLLLYLTLAPLISLPPTPEWKLLSFDTFAHGAFFAVQAALTWLWARRQTRWPRLARQSTAAVFLGCTMFGALIEVLQMTMPFNRHGEWSDLLSDSLGAAAALGLLALAAAPLRRRGWAIALLLPALSLPPSPARSQDLPRARATIAKLASRGMHGRGYVKQGEHKAAAYLRGRLRQLGLQPMAPDYTQPFELDVNTFPGAMRLRFSARSGRASKTESQELRPGLDFIAAPNCSRLRARKFYLDAPDSSVFIELMDQIAWQLQQRVDPALSSALLIRQTDIVRLNKPENGVLLKQYAGAKHPLIEVVPKLTASLANSQGEQAHLQVLAKSLPAWLSMKGSRGYVELEVDAQLQRHYQTQNLAAFIPGRTQPDSLLVVTAHYDHLGMMGRKAYFPGANDNASGVALLLELAAHYARPENRPACSVAFLLFGAEEAGLVGSSYFVQHPLVPLKQIKFLINLDLLGTGEEGATVVNGRVYEAAFQQLQKLNEAGHYLPSLAARGRAANSDHFPFSEAGVPAFFLYTRGGSKAYHDVNDTPDKLSLAGFAGAYGLVRDFLNARQTGIFYPSGSR